MSFVNQHFSQEISNHVTNRRKESFGQIIKIIKQKPPKTLMDIGCASGNFLFQLTDAYPAIEAVGIDKSASLIKEALKRQETRKNPRFFHLDIIFFNELHLHFTKICNLSKLLLFFINNYQFLVLLWVYWMKKDTWIVCFYLYYHW